MTLITILHSRGQLRYQDDNRSSRMKHSMLHLLFCQQIMRNWGFLISRYSPIAEVIIANWRLNELIIWIGFMVHKDASVMKIHRPFRGMFSLFRSFFPRTKKRARELTKLCALHAWSFNEPCVRRKRARYPHKRNVIFYCHSYKIYSFLFCFVEIRYLQQI